MLELGELYAIAAETSFSFRSVHDPRAGATHTVISNTTNGAWPIARFLAERLAA
ncbi:MAG: hypothetical protein H0T13_02715 [Actinobacteria bacterium]|nr:hypothetical protein [Actinomycetota bacterium]